MLNHLRTIFVYIIGIIYIICVFVIMGIVVKFSSRYISSIEEYPNVGYLIYMVLLIGFIFIPIPWFGKERLDFSTQYSSYFRSFRLKKIVFILIVVSTLVFGLHNYLEKNAVRKDKTGVYIKSNDLCAWHLYEYVDRVQVLSLNASDSIKNQVYRSSFDDYRSGRLKLQFISDEYYAVGNQYDDGSGFIQQVENKWLITIHDGLIEMKILDQKVHQ